MGTYRKLKKAFAFLESYGFVEYARQRSGSYYYSGWTNEKKKIWCYYDDTADEKIESPVWIKIYDFDCFGTQYDDVDVYRKEVALESGSPKERIRHAAEWLKNAIDTGVVSV